MTKLLIVCLGVILWLPAPAPAPAPEEFHLAQQIGNTPRAFFRFETSGWKYTIRYDGFVEVYLPGGSHYMRKRVFFLKKTGHARLERVYYLEHEGDLLLRYDVIGQGSHFARIEQQSRTTRWSIAFSEILGEAPVVNGDLVVVGDVEINKTNGKILRQD